MESDVFINLPPTRLFFRCAIPAAITSVFGALFSVVDGFFVGKFLGEDALAAINLITPILLIVSALSNMIATGASVAISTHLGGKNRQEASKVFSYSVRFILISSVIIGIVGFLFSGPMIHLFFGKASETAIAYSAEYLRVYAIFAPLLPIFFAMDNYLRICGRENLSMVINIAAQLGNVLLDFILIAVLRLGVKYAALASCISISVGSLVMLFLFAGKRMDIYYTRESISAKQFLAITANGTSEFFSTIAVSIMSVIINLFLLKYGGTTAVAAFSILMYVDEIIGMMNFGICDSLQPAISYCFGAGKIERMKAIFKRVVASTAIISVISFLFMYFVGDKASMIFIKPGETDLIQMSKEAIKIFAFSYLVGWVDMCFSSFFTALNRPARSLILSLFGTLLFPVLFLVILTAAFGLKGVWLMASIAGLASAVLSMVLYGGLKRQTEAKGERQNA